MLRSKMSRLLILTSFSLLAACSSTKQFYYKTGQLVQVTSCEGGSWSGCYQTAGQICQAKGYEVIERMNYKKSGFFSSSDAKELVFICKTEANITK